MGNGNFGASGERFRAVGRDLVVNRIFPGVLARGICRAVGTVFGVAVSDGRALGGADCDTVRLSVIDAAVVRGGHVEFRGERRPQRFHGHMDGGDGRGNFLVPAVENKAVLHRGVREYDTGTVNARTRGEFGAAVRVESERVRVDCPHGAERHVVGGHSRGKFGIPPGERVARQDRTCRGVNVRPEILRDGRDGTAAPCVESNRVAVGRPLRRDGQIVVGHSVRNRRRPARECVADSCGIIGRRDSFAGLQCDGGNFRAAARLKGNRGIVRFRDVLIVGGHPQRFLSVLDGKPVLAFISAGVAGLIEVSGLVEPAREAFAVGRRRLLRGDGQQVVDNVRRVIDDIPRAAVEVVHDTGLFRLGRPLGGQRDGVVPAAIFRRVLQNGCAVGVTVAIFGVDFPRGVPEHAAFCAPAVEHVASTRGGVHAGHVQPVADFHPKLSGLRGVHRGGGGGVELRRVVPRLFVVFVDRVQVQQNRQLVFDPDRVHADGRFRHDERRPIDDFAFVAVILRDALFERPARERAQGAVFECQRGIAGQ